MKTRKPAVAGQFYSNDSKTLKTDIETFFANAVKNKHQNLLAVIVPHAGYVFSGQIAADAYNQIDTAKKYKKVFLIGSSHRYRFNGAAVYVAGNYETPLGEVKVDTETGQKLVSENKCFTIHDDAHNRDHCLEVQLPFLQHLLKENLVIVPIIMGNDDTNEMKQIAKALEPYFTDENLFVISSDFSHYPTYENANNIDLSTFAAIQKNSPDEFLKTIEKNERQNIKNLATSCCGWSSVTMLLNITQSKNIDIELLNYKNSGDSFYGDKDKVVGYCAISFSKKNEEQSFQLNESEKKTLLKIARKTIENHLSHTKNTVFDASEITDHLKTKCGAFVSLHKNGNLRGCIGNFGSQLPLYELVQKMAISSATQDYRFKSVAESEINDIDIEISVLTPLQLISDISQIRLGIDGIYIKQGSSSGTFLPQVADQTKWTVEEFLGHCSRDKAGIGWDGWKTAEVYIYQAIVFSEKNMLNI